MKSLLKFKLAVFSLLAASTLLIGCSGKPSPTSPSPSSPPAPTSTFTITLSPTQTGTPTLTATVTATRTATLSPTKTYTSTNTLSPTITSTPTITFTPTQTPTITNTFTVTLTPTITPTFIYTFTPNPALTPACSTGNVVGIFGNNGTSSAYTSTAPEQSSGGQMWTSKYNLPVAATVNAIDIYAYYQVQSSPQIQVAIYNAASSPYTLVVASAVQTLFPGLNQLPIPSTALSAGNYYLAVNGVSGSGAVSYNASTYPQVSDQYYPVAFGSFPANIASITGGYATFQDLEIYAVYCGAPTSTPTITDTPTVTYTSTDTATATVTPTATTTFTPVACNTSQNIGYSATPGYLTMDNTVALTEVNLPQASDVTSFIIGNYNGVYGVTAQPVLFNDTGSNYPNILLYSSPVTGTVATGPLTVAVSPELSLPSGNYWIGFLEPVFGLAAADGVTATGLLLYANTYGFTPLPLDQFSPFPTTNSTFAVGNGGGLAGNLTVEITTCHP
jgi:hypothetical protein